MSFEICNRCTVRNCRKYPDTDLRGRGVCSSHRPYKPATKLVNQLWDEQPRELMELCHSAKLRIIETKKGLKVVTK
jgi:hypothetical protein